MKSTTILIGLICFLFSSFSQNCDKQLEINKFDKFKKQYVIKSNSVVFDKPSLILRKEISFWVIDSNKFFVHFEFTDSKKTAIQNNSEVGILLSNDEPILFNVNNVKFDKVGTTYKTGFDCQIKSKEQLNMFYKNSIVELKFYYSDESFELSTKEQGKIKKNIVCTIDEIGISNINYASSKQSINKENVLVDDGQSGCISIYRKVDKFDGTVTFTSPILNQITLYKVIKDNNVFYYMRLKCLGSTMNVMEKGVTILFENDLRIDRPEIEIDVDATSDGYSYSAFIDLSIEEMNIIANNQMTDFKLYIYDCIVNVFKRKKYMKYANCLLN